MKISRVLTEKITIDDFLFCAAKNKFEWQLDLGIWGIGHIFIVSLTSPHETFHLFFIDVWAEWGRKWLLEPTRKHMYRKCEWGEEWAERRWGGHIATDSQYRYWQMYDTSPHISSQYLILSNNFWLSSIWSWMAQQHFPSRAHRCT